MAYFNPIYYFIKSFIRLFTRKFFWVLLIFILIFLAIIIFNNNSVYAVDSNYTMNYNPNVDDQFRSWAGEDIWNNSNYDLFVGLFNNIYWFIYYDASKLPLDNNYALVLTPINNTSSGGKYFHYYDLTTREEIEGTDINCVYYAPSTNYLATNSSRVMIPTYFNNNNIYLHVIRSHFDLYDMNLNLLSHKTDSFFQAPYLVTSTSDIESWSFDYLVISPGSYGFDMRNYYGIDIVHNTIPYTFDIKNYYNSSTGFFEIPRNVLSNDFIIRNGNSFRFYFSYREVVELGGNVQYIDLGYFTISLTSSEQEEINEDSEKSVQGQMLSEQQKTNDKLDNIESSITDSNVDDITSDTLPSDSTEDITANGVNGIFTSIYNAFCTGTAQDIVFPIPFTDKNITLQADYVNSMLSSNGASWVIIIIQAFWWYLISRFIIKDVMDKINKIKSGNIEDIETTNIRGDML